MKNLKLTLVAILVGFMAQAQINTPAPSPAGSVYSKVGLTDVTIDYFRPKVKERTIFAAEDALQPFGTLWRTGANSGSLLTLSTDATIAGTKVTAGKYLILSIPGEKEWTFILYNDPSIGGNMGAYKEENVVVKTTVSSIKLSQPVEALTFVISDINETNTAANIHFMWADRAFKVPLEVSFDETVMADIAAKTAVNPSNYIQAANYYFTYDKDLNKALEWVDLYLASGNNSSQFWNIHLKAKILAKMGKKKEAIAAAKKSIEVAKASNGDDFGYIKRNEDLITSLK